MPIRAAACLLLTVLHAQVPAPTTPPAPAPTTTPETALRELLTAHCERHGASGASAAIALRDGSTIAAAVGKDAADAALQPTTTFLSGSIGKTYVAAIALQLVHDGKLALDGKVRDVLGKRAWYERLPNGDAITLRHLLCHQSGIPEHVWKKDFQDRVTAAGDRALTPEECVGYVLGDAPLAPPGSKWSYADTNYVLVGLCIEEITGHGYWDELRRRLLTPLHLDETFANEQRAMPGLACGMASGIGFTTGKTVVDGRYFTNPAFEYCGGGVRSTPRDLARWSRALFLGDVVPQELQAEQRRGVPAAKVVGGAYGLGCFVTTSPHGPSFGHSGVMPGYLSCTFAYPELGLATAVQFPTDNVRKVGDLHALCAAIAGLVPAAVAVPAGKGR